MCALQARLSRLLQIAAPQVGARKGTRHTERERLFSAVVEVVAMTPSSPSRSTAPSPAWNRAAERLFGFSAAEAVGSRIDIIVPPDGAPRVDEMLERVTAGERLEQLRDRAAAQGWPPRRCTLLSVSPIRSASGEIIGASKTAHDISESKRAQDALNQEIEERQRIFETSQDLILVTDDQGQFRSGQPRARRPSSVMSRPK